MTMNPLSAPSLEAPADATSNRRPAGGFWMRALLGAARRISIGQLTLIGPDGGRQAVAGSRPGPHAVLRIRRPRAVRRLLTGGDLGFAEAYLDGDWESPDLAALIELAARNEAAIKGALRGTALLRARNRLGHLLRPNTRAGSRRNIAEHYDLGNAFFERWLDPTMSYSSALFTAPHQSLADAQIAKYRRLAASLDLQPGQRVLEIGCGWGGFAELAAAEYGCHVTGITLSREQRDFARARIAKAGLEDKVEIVLADYRDVAGRFDRIASIEMFEAVGEAHWPTFFQRLRAALAPGGIAAMQVILIDEERFASYRRGADFIQRHVFPGGMLPSAGAFVREAEAARLSVDDALRFGVDYARTLSIWNTAFQAAWRQIAQLGFDERFKRLWEYYLAYSEAGFRTGSLDVAQFRLKPA